MSGYGRYYYRIKEGRRVMDNLLEKRFGEAEKGRSYWLYLQDKYKLDASGYVLLVPDKEDIVHLKERFCQYITNKNGSKGLILADQSLISQISNIKGDTLYAEACTRQEAENLMRFYCMYQFTSNLLIASLEKPDGRRGKNLIGKKGFCREEILDMVVFGIGKEQEAEETGNGF